MAARTVGEVQALVRAGGPVRALGTRHSFTDLPDTAGTLVTLSDIHDPPILDEATGTVDAPAGIRYGDLARWLHARGWALHNLGSLPHISVAGAIATGTHGSGDHNGILATAVRRLDYITATGEIARAGQNEPDFPGLVVGLGAYGIVVRVALTVQPTYQVRQDLYRGLRWEEALEHLPAITGAGYSVSIFTNWIEEDIGTIWVKTRLDTDTDPDADQILDAERIDSADSADTNLNPRGGIPGPWHERLPHFRLDATPSHGDELQSEYLIDPIHAAPALLAVRALGDRLALALLISELRTAAPDPLWLSGATGRGLFGIHFTWRNDPVRVRAAVAEIEAALTGFAARPHWGKLHLFDHARLRRVFPQLDDARTLYERLDPDGTFSNAHVEHLGIRTPRSRN